MLEQDSVGNHSISFDQWPKFVHVLVVGELHIPGHLVQELGSVGEHSVPQGLPLLLPLDLGVRQEQTDHPWHPSLPCQGDCLQGGVWQEVEEGGDSYIAICLDCPGPNILFVCFK